MIALAMIALTAIATVVEAWAIMILIGIIHSEWLDMMPTLDFGSSFLVGLGISLFASVWAAFYRAIKKLSETL